METEKKRRIVLVSDDPNTYILKNYLDGYAEVLIADDFNTFGETLREPNLSGAIIDMTLKEDSEEILEVFSNMFPDIPAVALYESANYPLWSGIPANGAIIAFAKPIHPSTVVENLTNYIEEAELHADGENQTARPESIPTVKTVKALGTLTDEKAEFFPTAAPGAYIAAVRMLKSLLVEVDTYVDADMQKMLGQGKIPIWENVEHITDISSEIKKTVKTFGLAE